MTPSPAAVRERPRRGLFRPALATLAGVAILTSLGVWQLKRLAWKEALIAQITARAGAPPQPLPPEAEWASLDPPSYEYRHVRFAATLEPGREALAFRPAGGPLRQPGYLSLVPARLASGAVVIVNRGFVPAALKDPATRPEPAPAGPAPIVGLMRAPEARNPFTPADAPAKGDFYSRDPAPVAARFGLARVAPFIVDADRAAAPAPGVPSGGETEIAFPNNQLSYALTWFGLALALLGVFAAFALRSRAEPRR
ncbi:SURF1 family protein [Methylocella sp.]|uniref:SURF1 family protein n=1 Tax=Methylocella sp. TaxID=1978226 RepID=UPI00378530D9